MTYVILRIVIIAVILGAIWLGVRRIWRDWSKQFQQVDKARHDRDIKERARPDVITLERGKDGTFRPPDDDGR